MSRTHPHLDYGFAGLLLALIVSFGATADPDALLVGDFSSADPDSNGHPTEWRPVSFGDVDTKTRYELRDHSAEDGITTVVQAVGNGGATG